METDTPLVSIIMATYNRAHTLLRAITSVLNQTYGNLELIIVDDGSTDNTSEVIMKFTDKRIRVLKHDNNRGVTAAKNTGLKEIRGEWFTTFDSDDEMVSDAVETMISIPLYFDQAVTAITCNCWEPLSKTFLGKGLDKNGYIKCNETMPFCEGDFWGLTKSSLLGGDSFNENLIGTESTLWYKINARANGYYIHRALNIVHVEGSDRVTRLTCSNTKFKRQIRHYASLLDEELYLSITKKCRPDEYYHLCRTGLIMMRISKNKNLASKYGELLKPLDKSIFVSLALRYELPAVIYEAYYKLIPPLKKAVRKMFFGFI